MYCILGLLELSNNDQDQFYGRVTQGGMYSISTWHLYNDVGKYLDSN